MSEGDENPYNPLIDVIIQISEELEKSNPEIAAKLLSNFNSYNEPELENMLNKFQELMERVVSEGDTEDVLVDVYYIVKNKEAELKQIIMFK